MTTRFAAILATMLALAACSRDPQKLKQRYLDSGDNYIAKKKYSEAIVQYRNAVAQDQLSGEARFKLGDAYERTGDIRSAFREYVRAADLMPNNVDAQLRAGMVLTAASQFPEAKARAMAALAKDPRNVKALTLLGSALAGLKDIDGAIEQVEAAIDADPQLIFSYANLGVLEMKKGDRVAAEAAFQRAIGIDPKSIDARLNLGNFYRASNLPAKAETELKAAHAIDPKSPAVNRTLAAFYTIGGRRAEAEPYLKVLAAETKAVAYKLVLIDYYIANRRIEEATSLLGPLSKEKDGFVPAKLRLASIDFGAGRRPQAYEALEEVLKQYPNHERVLEAKARLLILDRKFDEAAQLSARVVKANPQAIRSHFLHAMALEALGSLDESIKSFQRVLELSPSAVVAQTQLATIHLARGDAKSALSFLNQALKLQPRSGSLRFLLGKALLQSGNLAGAEAELVPLAKANPASMEIQTWLGRLYLAKNNRDQARSIFTRVLASQPDSFMALNGLVTLDLVEKKPAAARARLDARLAKGGDDPQILFLAGNSFLTMGDATRAEPLLRKVVELAPTNIAAYRELARLYLAQNRLNEARADIETAAKHHTNPVGLITMAGMILEMQRQPAEARKHYERALAIDPNAAVAANNLAWQYADAGENLDLALKLAQTARSKMVDNAQVIDTLGWIYYKKGLTSLAVTTLLEGVQHSPSAPLIHYHLGLAYLKSGNRTGAQQALQRALKLNSSFDGAEDAKQVLAGING